LVKGNPSVLLIHGDADIYTPPQHGERLQRAFGQAANAELMILPGVEHTFAYRDANQAYENRVLAFLRDALVSSAA
jgi:dipeptidyl aminopeptidase/acylaminoacyl peptidase